MMLRGLRPYYEGHHRVHYTDDALEAAARLSARYITDRFLPDKAIDLIDEAGSKRHLELMSLPPELRTLEAHAQRACKRRRKRQDRRRITRRRPRRAPSALPGREFRR